MKQDPALLGLGRYMALGFQMVVVTGVITWVGWWLDEKTGKAPIFLVVFFVLGAAAGFVTVHRAFRDEGKPPR
jgi:F0F1-type ATP synthase assembly protein I